MRSDTPRLGRVGGPGSTPPHTDARSRGQRDLAQCAVCEKLFAPELLGPKDAGPQLRRWDPRPRGPVGWRIGVPETKSAMLDLPIKACAGCGGKVSSHFQEPLWRRAKGEWANVRESDPWFELCGRRGGK